jgi:preprotein translocase subunit SecG
MIYLLYLIHVVISLFLIMVVLLQQGKGADLSVFGGGATQAAFGARGAASLLHKLTVWGFVAFIVTTISIGFMGSAGSRSSVMSNLPEQGEAAAVEAEATDEAMAEDAATGAETAPAEPGPAVDDAATDEATDDGAAEEDAGDDGTDDNSSGR